MSFNCYASTLKDMVTYKKKLFPHAAFAELFIMGMRSVFCAESY
jgi:hypothetical protein